MWLCWLLGVIVITNSYKSKVKSNYILEPKFATKWQRLEELRDFAVILAYERPKDGFHSWTEGELNRLPPLTFKKGKKFGEQKCPKEGRFWQQACFTLAQDNQDVRNACAFFRESNSGDLNYRNICEKFDCTSKYKEMLERYTGTLEPRYNVPS